MVRIHTCILNVCELAAFGVPKPLHVMHLKFYEAVGGLSHVVIFSIEALAHDLAPPALRGCFTAAYIQIARTTCPDAGRQYRVGQISQCGGYDSV